MTKALYPGSFDPVTNGHLDIIERAQKLFDVLIVAVVHNPNKQTLFTLQERKALVEASLEETGLTGAQVITYDGLLIECARSHRVDAIVRGLRVNSDFDYEFQMALMNRDIDPHVESVFLMTGSRYIFLSSSIVKEVESYSEDISHLVPKVVDAALAAKLSERAQKP